MTALQALAQQYKNEIVQTAQDMIRINSQSLHEGEMADYVTAKMKALHYDAVTVDRYGSVFGMVKGTGGGSSVMLNCHLDVVDGGDPARWKYPPYSGEIAEGRIWGRGASDTKGTFAIQLYIPIILREAGLLPKGDVLVAGVVAEEIAGFGAMMQAREGRMLTDYAILGEATENDLAIASRGNIHPFITVTGKACHASVPETGCNPISYLKYLLPKLETMEKSRDELFGETIMSVTRIVTSEKGNNIIPNAATVYMDVRQSGEDSEDMIRAKLQAIVDSIPMDGITTEVGMMYFPLTTYTGVDGDGFQGEYPFSVSADTPYVKLAKEAVESAVGHSIQTKPWPFATDTGHYAAKGVKCIGYSPAEVRCCHTTVDSIDLAMLEEGIAGYLGLTAAFANSELSQ